MAADDHFRFSYGIILFIAIQFAWSDSFSQASFYDRSKNHVAFEIWGSGIHGGFHYARKIKHFEVIQGDEIRGFKAILNGDLAVDVGVSSFFNQNYDLVVDIKFPTYTCSAIYFINKGRHFGEYLEAGLASYLRTDRRNIFPILATGLYLTGRASGLFGKVGFTNVEIIPFFQLQVGYRF